MKERDASSIVRARQATPEGGTVRARFVRSRSLQLSRNPWHALRRAELVRVPEAVIDDHEPAHPRVVENTGFEPVTSWLQTRRSPN